MDILGLQKPFFRPVWRRVAIVVICLAWGTFEYLGGYPAWGVLFIAIGIYSGWTFFFDFHPPEEGDDK
ncbi:MAG: DUF3329 domain-containing protein [Paracoccaceae bacterium]